MFSTSSTMFSHLSSVLVGVKAVIAVAAVQIAVIAVSQAGQESKNSAMSLLRHSVIDAVKPLGYVVACAVNLAVELVKLVV